MNKKKLTFMDRILSNSERILVCIGLLFLAAAILICTLWDTSTKPVNSPRTGEPVLQKALSDNVLIDINSSDAEQLELIHGIGPVLAKRIVEYRNENGPFHSVDDLKKVQGIGDKKLEEIRYYVLCLQESTPPV